MHIHSSSPNSGLPEEIAATKIQAGFRGYRVRKQLKEIKPIKQTKLTNNCNNLNNNKENYGLNQSFDQQNQQFGLIHSTLNNNRRLNFNINNKTIEEKSATKIQAGVRGFLVRKKQKLASDAATKIQASYRGFKVRKDIKKNRK